MKYHVVSIVTFDVKFVVLNRFVKLDGQIFEAAEKGSTAYVILRGAVRIFSKSQSLIRTGG